MHKQLSNMRKRQMNEERESMRVRNNMEARLNQMNERIAVLQYSFLHCSLMRM